MDIYLFIVLVRHSERGERERWGRGMIVSC